MNNKQTLEFVTYKQSLALKELGFNEPCFGYYVDGELRGINLGMEELGGKEPYYQRFGFHQICNSYINNSNKVVTTSPTYSQAFRWFREKYDGVCEITRKEDGNHSEFIGWIFIDNKRINVVSYWGSKTYEETESACLDKLIDLLMSNKVISSPKEKAEELFFKYRNLENKDSYINNYNAKKCALIAVNEILLAGEDVDEFADAYWIQVKQEIEKL